MKQCFSKNLQNLILVGFLWVSGLYLTYCRGNASEQDSSQISETPPVYIFTDSLLFIQHPAWAGPDSLWCDSLLRRYAEKKYRLFWFRYGEPVEYTLILFQLCRESAEALDRPIQEDAEKLSSRLEAIRAEQDSNSIQILTEIDISLSLLFLKYANRNWVGLPESIRNQTGWRIKGKDKNLYNLLENFIEGKDRNEFQRQAIYSQYDDLGTWLAKYRKIEALGGWPQLDWNGQELQYGDTAEILIKVRQLLRIQEDLSDSLNSPVFDSVLTRGVRAFQIRHGIQPTGMLEALTFRAMRYSVKDRIRQILINQERCRWAPPEPTGKYIAVNIPDFKLMLFDQQKLQWSCNAVVGKEKTNTVIFSNQLEYIVFSPYWNVPRSILANELLPALRKNPEYLKQHNMEVYTGSGKVIASTHINWHLYKGYDFPYNIRQNPGRNNALGRVKFLFPNEYNIYLHDTPAKNLFAQPVRAFSHGCIRIQEPIKLAKYLLQNDPEWPEEKIMAAVDRDAEEQVTLKEKIPVFIAYFTAFVDTEGRIHFREDIYKHDKKLGELLRLDN